MKEPSFKMSNCLVGLLSLALLFSPLISASPSSEPVSYKSYDTGYSSGTNAGNGFISSPSIYSYTIANQSPPYKAQQQVKAAYDNDYNYNNNNYVNFTNYRSGNSNRNLYYTNDGNSKNTPASAASTSATALPTQPAPLSGCYLDRLAVYKVVLHTYWTRDLFPKHYPDWRPTAQWTKTLGRTHNAAYALYHIGQQATPGVKQFAESGKPEILDSVVGEQQQQQQNAGNSFTSFVSTGAASSVAAATAAQRTSTGNQPQQHGERNVFDEFNIPAIYAGAGRSEAKFFVDSNHSLVSLMTRIVPSPDWFIGVDSFQLCVGGSWIDTVTVEMDPLDAGTDNGFTFTAPNWPTSPQGVIYRITSRYPAHPASSFFYPKNKRLPPIATFQFIKLKEYELSEVFNFAEDDRKYETVKTQTHLETEHNHVEMNNELSASIERERQNEISPEPTSESERDRIRSKLLAKMNPIYNSSASNSALSAANVVPKNDKNALMQNIANTYRHRSETSPTTAAKRRRMKQTSPSRDCRVSHWSEWSACSKTCGIGEMHRYRKVIRHGKRGGRPCPPLEESKWCGSEKGCHRSPATYFNWSNT